MGVVADARPAADALESRIDGSNVGTGARFSTGYWAGRPAGFYPDILGAGGGQDLRVRILTFHI